MYGQNSLTCEYNTKDLEIFLGIYDIMISLSFMLIWIRKGIEDIRDIAQIDRSWSKLTLGR